MGKITQSTLVPLSFIAFVFVAAFWFSEVRSQTQNNTDKIETVKVQSMKIDIKLDEIAERLSRIEGRLGDINSNLRGNPNGKKY